MMHDTADANLSSLLDAIRAIPSDAEMVEHNPDEGPRYFCCGNEVSFHIHPSRWAPGSIEGRTHASDCWYVRLIEAARQFEQVG